MKKSDTKNPGRTAIGRTLIAAVVAPVPVMAGMAPEAEMPVARATAKSKMPSQFQRTNSRSVAVSGLSFSLTA